MVSKKLTKYNLADILVYHFLKIVSQIISYKK